MIGQHDHDNKFIKTLQEKNDKQKTLRHGRDMFWYHTHLFQKKIRPQAMLTTPNDNEGC